MASCLTPRGAQSSASKPKKRDGVEMIVDRGAKIRLHSSESLRSSESSSLVVVVYARQSPVYKRIRPGLRKRNVGFQFPGESERCGTRPNRTVYPAAPANAAAPTRHDRRRHGLGVGYGCEPFHCCALHRTARASLRGRIFRRTRAGQKFDADLDCESRRLPVGRVLRSAEGRPARREHRVMGDPPKDSAKR